MSEPVNYEDDSRFYAVHHEVTDEQRTSHEPSPAPEPEDASEPADLEEGAR